MDFKKLQRNAEKIHSVLEELPDGRLVTKKAIKIYIPSRFIERGLAEIGIKTHIVGIYAIVLDDTYYAVSLVNAMVQIEPSSTTKVMFDEEQYYEFSFDPGSTVLSSTNLVKTDTLVYRIYAEIISKGNVPWYLGYLDLAKIFDTAKYHAGANIGKNHEVTELVISIISRDKENRHLNYRQVVKDFNEIKTKPPVYISLKNLTYAATNTTNRIAGSYFGDGLVSALVNVTDRVEGIENILRR